MARRPWRRPARPPRGSCWSSFISVIVSGITLAVPRDRRSGLRLRCGICRRSRRTSPRRSRTGSASRCRPATPEADRSSGPQATRPRRHASGPLRAGPPRATSARALGVLACARRECCLVPVFAFCFLADVAEPVAPPLIYGCRRAGADDPRARYARSTAWSRTGSAARRSLTSSLRGADFARSGSTVVGTLLLPGTDRPRRSARCTVIPFVRPTIVLGAGDRGASRHLGAGAGLDAARRRVGGVILVLHLLEARRPDAADHQPPRRAPARRRRACSRCDAGGSCSGFVGVVLLVPTLGHVRGTRAVHAIQCDRGRRRSSAHESDVRTGVVTPAMALIIPARPWTWSGAGSGGRLRAASSRTIALEAEAAAGAAAGSRGSSIEAGAGGRAARGGRGRGHGRAAGGAAELAGDAAGRRGGRRGGPAQRRIGGRRGDWRLGVEDPPMARRGRTALRGTSSCRARPSARRDPTARRPRACASSLPRRTRMSCRRRRRGGSPAVLEAAGRGAREPPSRQRGSAAAAFMSARHRLGIRLGAAGAVSSGTTRRRGALAPSSRNGRQIPRWLGVSLARRGARDRGLSSRADAGFLKLFGEVRRRMRGAGLSGDASTGRGLHRGEARTAAPASRSARACSSSTPSSSTTSSRAALAHPRRGRSSRPASASRPIWAAAKLARPRPAAPQAGINVAFGAAPAQQVDPRCRSDEISDEAFSSRAASGSASTSTSCSTSAWWCRRSGLLHQERLRRRRERPLEPLPRLQIAGLGYFRINPSGCCRRQRPGRQSARQSAHTVRALGASRVLHRRRCARVAAAPRAASGSGLRNLLSARNAALHVRKITGSEVAAP